jgi:tetratricopeptide (TPR) repeat protein
MIVAANLQDEPATVAEGPTLWQRLVAFVSEPGVLEVVLAVALVAAVVFVWWRLAALVRNARAREALADYLLGVEQALQGDLAGAEKRLRRVLEKDPENHFARLMLGKVLGDLGQAEQAHQQHLYLQKAFAVDSGENDLLLAQSLLAAGMPCEAADVAEQAMARMPQHGPGWDFLYRARLQQGDHQAAARAGRKRILLLRDSGERQRAQLDLARTFAELGTRAWRDGDAKAARAALREAQALDEGQQRLPLLRARLDADEHGAAELARRLAAPTAERALAVTSAQLPAETVERLPMATFEGLLEPARWRCRAGEAPLLREVVQCPRCGIAAPGDLVEPALVAAIESATEAMDRIDVNEAHVRRLVRRFVDGDQSVAGELVAVGEAAVHELLRTAWKNSGRVQEQAIDALHAMGPQIAPALFAASDALGQARIWGVGEGPAAIVGKVVQRFDREALPHVQQLFTSTRPDHRRILIDYFLGLGDVEAFQSVLERFPPMEILHRLNNAARDVLQAFLASIPRGHFLVESLLLEPTFYRDEALLAAVPDAEDPEVLIAVMLRRGASRQLTTSLIAGVADDRLAATSMRVLEELGERVLEHVLAAYASPEASEDACKRLARVLVRGGGAAAGHITDGFGPEPTMFDDRLRELLVIIGDDAVDAMLGAYERSGWLEKVSAGLLRRHNNRRVQIARALGELATRPATRALKTLLKREKDDNLRLHLERALHGAGGVDG